MKKRLALSELEVTSFVTQAGKTMGAGEIVIPSANARTICSYCFNCPTNVATNCDTQKNCTA